MRMTVLNQAVRIPDHLTLHTSLALPLYFLVVTFQFLMAGNDLARDSGLMMLISLVGGLVLVLVPSLSPALGTVMVFMAGRSELPPIWSGVTDVGFLILLGFLVILIRRLLLPTANERYIRWSMNPLLIGICAFSIIYWAQFSTSLQTDYALEKAIRVSLYTTFLMLLVAHFAIDSSFRIQFCRIYLIIVGGMSGLALLLAIAQHGLLGIQRIVPIGGGPITLGRFTGFAALICLALYIRRDGNRLSLAGFAWFSALTLMNGSRGPLFALIITAAIIVVPTLTIRPVRERAFRLILFLWGTFVLMAFSFAIAVAMGAPFAGRYVLLFTGERGGSSVGTRFDMVSRTGEFVSLAPAWGNGVGSWPQLTRSSIPNSYPHNIVTELLVENGMFATALFLFLLICAFLVAARYMILARSSHHVTDAMIGLGLLVFAFIGAQVSGDMFDNRYLWVSVGWIASLGLWCESMRIPANNRLTNCD